MSSPIKWAAVSVVALGAWRFAKMLQEPDRTPEEKVVRLDTHKNDEVCDMPILAAAARLIESKSSESGLVVTLTYAQSLDGSIAAVKGRPTLLSGPKSMKMTHCLRAMHGFLGVGIGTVLADNPSLTVRLVSGLHPRPVVFDSDLRCPVTCRFMGRQPIIACTATGLTAASGVTSPLVIGNEKESAKDTRARALIAAGAAVLVCAADSEAHLDLGDCFRRVKRMWGSGSGGNGRDSIMVEGGATIIGSLLATVNGENLVDQLIVTIAPTMVGGYRPLTKLLQPTDAACAALGFPRLHEVAYHVLDDDIVCRGTFRPGSSGK